MAKQKKQSHLLPPKDKVKHLRLSKALRRRRMAKLRERLPQHVTALVILLILFLIYLNHPQ